MADINTLFLLIDSSTYIPYLEDELSYKKIRGNLKAYVDMEVRSLGYTEISDVPNDMESYLMLKVIRQIILAITISKTTEHDLKGKDTEIKSSQISSNLLSVLKMVNEDLKIMESLGANFPSIKVANLISNSPREFTRENYPRNSFIRRRR